MDKKFELTNESITYNGKTLYRIKALKDFGTIKTGDLGGFIQKEENLSHFGDCWIYDEAKVFDDAKVYDNARVYNDARIFDDAEVFNSASVYHRATISDDAKIYGVACIGEDAHVFGDAEVFNSAFIYGDAQVFGRSKVYGNAIICGNAILKEDQVVCTGLCKVDLSKNLKENIRCQTNLFPQKDYVIAYKQVHKDLTSIYDETFQYKIGEWIKVEEPEISNRACASGLHFSNVNYWDMAGHGDATYLMAKIMLDDIITVQCGKIRCKRAFIIDKYEIED